MNNDLLRRLKELCNIEPGSKVELLFDTISDQVPILGKILTSYKIHRLGQRLRANEDQIAGISEKVQSIKDTNFLDLLKNFLFPTILQEMLDEDEDNKIAYFLDGFEQVIDNVINNQSKILIYYDVLKELRFIEIEYLITSSVRYQTFLMDNENEDESDIGSNLSVYFKSEEFEDLKIVIQNKLERLGLLDTGRLITYREVVQRMDEESKLPNYFSSNSLKSKHPLIDLDDIRITEFGESFLDFFNLLDAYKD